MPDLPLPTSVDELPRRLLAVTAETRAGAEVNPFGNPLMSIALAVTRMLDQGVADIDGLHVAIKALRDEAFNERAKRIAAYVGSDGETRLEVLAQRMARPDPADSPVPWNQFKTEVERPCFSAVFTAHPTFSLPWPVNKALASLASGESVPTFETHRPTKPTLAEEFAQAIAAIQNGRDALDVLSAALLTVARATWPDRWHTLTPRPIILASWVGYDTDGRTDITWWDTIGLRLEMKRLQLVRTRQQVASFPVCAPVVERIDLALRAIETQIGCVPANGDPENVARFARTLVELRDDALTTPAPLVALFDAAINAADTSDRLPIAVARAGLVSHGLALAHTHVRLNSAQLHNAVRQRLGIAEPPEDPARRRTVLAAINAALDHVESVNVDFGSLLAEQASAVRLMMTIVQIVKHVDSESPIRFLIAETETGYTLLAALWLAKRFGIAEQIEISPLFETADALEHGARVIDEALRSPHYRAYVQATGKFALQFGYSDSGRYVGQLAATYMVERLRLKIAEVLTKYRLSGIKVILFDTHGESIGRGGHPRSLADRLAYLFPNANRLALSRAGVAVREESAFQGGDGYLLFGTSTLALATVAGIAEHAFSPRSATQHDPIYEEADFAADFFSTIRASMAELVEDPGYVALLGAFGPALLDPSGSRPDARQRDSGGPAVLRHPSELRAIPNNAILQQLGWFANTVHGLGAAIARHPEMFVDMQSRSDRFQRAMAAAAAALGRSDVDVLHGVIATIDPGSWLDRAASTKQPGRALALVSVAQSLEGAALWAPALAMFRHIQADHLALRSTWGDAPRMPDRVVLLHALRLALIQRIWLLGTRIPDFSPRSGITRELVTQRVLRLDIPNVVKALKDIFPAESDLSGGLDYGEPPGPRSDDAYVQEHREIFEPMGRLFDLVREIAGAITHEVGAFG
jgi:phosphoenolpyruvate carboxylase